MASLKNIYERRMPALERVADQLRCILVKVVAAIEDRTSCAPKYAASGSKAFLASSGRPPQKGCKPEEALSVCSDLIGGRVVCNNVEDVYRFAQLLKERLPGAPRVSRFRITSRIRTRAATERCM